MFKECHLLLYISDVGSYTIALNNNNNGCTTVFCRDIVCLRNMSINTLHKGAMMMVVVVVVMMMIP
jgi:hypothetical protein